MGNRIKGVPVEYWDADTDWEPPTGNPTLHPLGVQVERVRGTPKPGTRANPPQQRSAKRVQRARARKP